MSHVTLRLEGRAAVITLDRPEARNALTGEMIDLLVARLGEADADERVRAIVLTGADPAFCAGLDLGALASESGGLRGRKWHSRPWPQTRKPVIGAVNGPAVTGGLEIALRCDFLVASERASFADTHARVGILPGWGLSALLPHAIGVRRAIEMSVTGNFMAADEALRFGLVNRVVPHPELLPAALALAEDIAGVDPEAAVAMLAALRKVAEVAVGDGFAVEAEARSAYRKASRPDDVARDRAAVIERGRSQVQ
ncbi:MAG TPA: enoyl-CoA hydratase [Acidimicrobiales bacterium]|nr:enoyl-CoA hydratase [Acidimicrobiales bacterium]